MKKKRSFRLVNLILVSGVTFVVTFFAVGRFAVRELTRSEKRANISEITSLLRIAEPLHAGNYDEAKRKLCDLLLRLAFEIGRLKRSSLFGEREEANRSLAPIGAFYESNGGYLDSYFIVDAPRYIEDAKKELNE